MVGFFRQLIAIVFVGIQHRQIQRLKIVVYEIGYATVMGYTDSGFVGVSRNGQIYLIEESDLEHY